MSFIGGIVEGVTDGVRAVLGLPDDDPKPRRAHRNPVPARSARQVRAERTDRFTPVAADHSVGYGSTGPYGVGTTYARTTLAAAPDAVAGGRTAALLAQALRDAGVSTQLAPQSTPTGAATGVGVPTRPPIATIYDAAVVGADGSAGYVGDSTTLANVGPRDAQLAAAHVQRGLDYYARTFGRAGVDGAGGGISVVLHDTTRDDDGAQLFHGNGGYFTTPDANGIEYEAIRFGDGTRYRHDRGGLVDQLPMLHADDLTIHELTHGVIKRETGHDGGTEDEAGATNEALADVMAAAATRDWRLGEKMYRPGSDFRALRDIARPNDGSAVHGLWTTMREVRARSATEGFEEHFASGVVSHAVARMQQRIGGEAGWRAVEQLGYATITGGQLGGMTFAETARAMRAQAERLWGAGSTEHRVVDAELRRAGL